MKKRALDLFCGAGGASRGLADAGFDVVGVDIAPQPRYPYEFHQADIVGSEFTDAFLTEFDLIWASPPCQAFTAYKRRPNHVKARENLIPMVRRTLRLSGIPYVIENVPGAPLERYFTLCGSMFGLDVRRHRIFETSFPVFVPACNHASQSPKFPPATNRKNLRRTVEVGVWRIPIETQRRAMGIGWMRLPELSQAIPPRYAQHIGRAAMECQ